MGKILIKNKKGSHEKPAQTKKNAAAAPDQALTATATATTTTDAPTDAPAQDPNTTPQDPSNPAPSTQENQGGRNESQAKSDYAPKTGLFSYF